MSRFTTPQGRILTEHSQESLLRHGFSEPFALIDRIMDMPDRVATQTDGSTVYIQRIPARGRRYNLVVEGEDGIVTTLRNVSPQELKNLARNYGWEPWLESMCDEHYSGLQLGEVHFLA